MNKVIELKNLTKYYGKSIGIDDLNLDVREGEIFGFIGPNGSGKSTTIRTMMNIINKTSGHVYLFNEEFNERNTDILKNIGYLPSEVHLYSEYTVMEAINYHASFYKNVTKKRINYLVNLFDLNVHKKINTLSFGTLKKVGIILALLHNPKLLILDEPTSGLDPIMQNVFYKLLLEEKKKGTTIFYSTHILSEVKRICDRVGIIKNGKLLKIEKLKDLFDKNLHVITLNTTDSNLLKLYPDTYFTYEGDINKFIKNIAKYKVDKLLIEEASLEDLFLHYYEEN